MNLNFDKKQLKTDIAVLEEKGVKSETAENIAKFKQALEYAAYFENGTSFMDRENLPEEVYDTLDNLQGFLDDAWDSIQRLFMSDEEAKINDPSYYRKAIYHQ